MPNIKIGDLVMVVKPMFCGCNMASRHIGQMHTVSGFKLTIPVCGVCLEKSSTPLLIAICGDVLREVSVLKKIDPLPEDETINEDLEVSA
jgi:hypothetical protein